ncbi:ABC transporter permease subunit [Rhizobium puerariae]|uniref:ABC transporter permease subunit n=1 Tax=Rhizobium puerariae TaxID=1585791 RepID=A0ABV6AF26_9HYPH
MSGSSPRFAAIRQRLRTHGGLWPAGVFLVVLFAIPVVQVLSLSGFDEAGNLSFVQFERLLVTSTYFQVLINTFWLTIKVTLLCLLIGYPIAYLLANVDMRSRNALLVWVLVPMWTSFLVRILAWMVILGRNGVLNQTLRQLGITNAPLVLTQNNIGVMIGSLHAMLPIAILMMLSVMMNIDRSLGRAAATLGAQGPMIFFRIYLPLSLPGIAASGLMVFVSVLGFFIAPQMLGSPSEIVISQVIITQLSETLDWNFASALSVVLLLCTFLVVVLFDKAVGMAALTGDMPGAGQRRGGGLATALSRIGRRSMTAAGWTFVWLGNLLPSRRLSQDFDERPGVSIWLLGILGVLFLALPTFFLIPISLSENRFLAWPPKGFTWNWYAAYFNSVAWRDATIRSILLGLGTAAMSMALGLPAAFVLARQKVYARGAVLALLLLPMVVPHIIVAVGLFYIYARIGLVGTNFGLMLGNAIFSLPYVVITVMAVLRNYDERLDQAAWTLGANRFTTFRRITLPLLKSGVVTGFLFAFMKAVDELAIALFVADAGTNLIPKKLWEEMSYKIDPSLAAVSTLILLIVGVAIAITQVVGASDRTQRRR